MSTRQKTKLQKTHEFLAQANECQVKIPSAKLALCGTQREKQAGVLSSDILRIPRGESESAQVIARMGLHLQQLKVSRSLDEVVQNNHPCPGETSFALHSAPGHLFSQGRSQPEIPALL